MKMNFSDRLKELMTDISTEDLSKRIGLKNKNRIYDWLRGDYIPKLETLIKIANLFECSLDYLLCRSDNDEKIANNNSIIFHDRLLEIMNEKKLIKQDFRKNKILSSGLCYSIFNLKNIPYIDNIIKIADFLNVSVDYLVGRV